MRRLQRRWSSAPSGSSSRRPPSFAFATSCTSPSARTPRSRAGRSSRATAGRASTAARRPRTSTTSSRAPGAASTSGTTSWPRAGGATPRRRTASPRRGLALWRRQPFAPEGRLPPRPRAARARVGTPSSDRAEPPPRSPLPHVPGSSIPAIRRRACLTEWSASGINVGRSGGGGEEAWRSCSASTGTSWTRRAASRCPRSSGSRSRTAST